MGVNANLGGKFKELASVLHIKAYGEGGEITTPQLALIGEEHERVINSKKPNAPRPIAAAIRDLPTKVMPSVASLAMSGGGGIVQHITGSAYDADVIAVAAGVSAGNLLADAANF